MGKTISQWNFLPLSTWTPTLTFHSLSCTIPALCTLQRIHLGQILPPVILGCWGGWIRKTSSIWLSSKRFWEYRNHKQDKNNCSFKLWSWEQHLGARSSWFPGSFAAGITWALLVSPQNSFLVLTESSKPREQPQGGELKGLLKGSLILHFSGNFPANPRSIQPWVRDFWIYSLPCFVSKACWMLQLARTVQAKDAAAKPGTPKLPPSPNPG